MILWPCYAVTYVAWGISFAQSINQIFITLSPYKMVTWGMCTEWDKAMRQRSIYDIQLYDRTYTSHFAQNVESTLIQCWVSVDTTSWHRSMYDIQLCDEIAWHWCNYIIQTVYILCRKGKQHCWNTCLTGLVHNRIMIPNTRIMSLIFILYRS